MADGTNGPANIYWISVRKARQSKTKQNQTKQNKKGKTFEIEELDGGTGSCSRRKLNPFLAVTLSLRELEKNSHCE